MVTSVMFQVVGDQRVACESCERRVERLLKKMDGVRQVRAQANAQRIEVLVDTDMVDVPRLAEQLRVAGYDTSISAP